MDIEQIVYRRLDAQIAELGSAWEAITIRPGSTAILVRKRTDAERRYRAPAGAITPPGSRIPERPWCTGRHGSVAPHPDATPREAPGSFREHDIHPFPGGMTPISWPFIPAEMASWVDHVNALDPSRAVFPEALAALHCRFERIHPFLDGNGRTGRLILNLILVRHGYPPAIIYKRDRARYLRALQRADTGDASALGEMLARAILDSLHRFVIPAVADADRLVPLAALETPA